jgi:predicted metal-binding membrane protein
MPASSASTVEWIARRERAVVLIGLVLAIALAWAWLAAGGGMNAAGERAGAPMNSMPGMRMPGMDGGRAAPGAGREAAVVFAMWSVMIIAMMLPSAAPVILLAAAISRARASATAVRPATAFAGGYVLIWTLFSAAATMVHLGLERATLISSTLRTTSGVLAAILLVAAGIYQLTPLKGACLRHCRSPIQFLTRHWRQGTAGALRLGILHGGYCVGCCWALMGLLFVGGAMTLWWIAAVAAFILAEKVAFLGTSRGRLVSGAGLVAAGAVVLLLK